MPKVSSLVRFLLPFSTVLALAAQVSVVQNRYDDANTGANLHETNLTPSNVNVSRFGKLYNYSVDGAVYAQPLYIPAVSIAGGSHNVVYVATMEDKLYAFDADKSGDPLWLRDFTNPAAGVTPVPVTDITDNINLNLVGNAGIMGTPVIDPAKLTLYLVARTKERGRYVQRLHAIDIHTGKDTVPAVEIAAQVASTAADAVNGVLHFYPKAGNQRPALALVNGAVVIAWASHEDIRPYHGWIMAYRASTLKQIGALCVTPNGEEGGVWQSGRGPAVDGEGNIYFETGNGTWDGTQDFGNSLLRLRVGAHSLDVEDYFTPENYPALNQRDADLGSSGPLLVPGTNILILGTKQGRLYLLDKQRLGHEAPGNPGLIQDMAIEGGRMLSGTAYWLSPQGPLVYVWGEADFLKAFRFNGKTIDPNVFAKGNFASSGSPGGAITVSADGSKPGTGIVWATLTSRGSADHGNAPGVLYAYNAETLAELWNSEQDRQRDRLGTLVKFVPPLVVGGKVYVASYDNAVRVYGQLQPGQTTTSSAVPMPEAKSSSGAGTAASGIPSGALRGKQLFERCAACHGGDSPNRRMGPPLQGLFQKSKLLNGQPVTDETVRAFILQGGQGMPSYQGVLSPEQLGDIVDYLHSM
jgi:mono/diheme cytochrome c family protein